jgi:hypothetical protein
MAKGQQRGNREQKKPKKDKPRVVVPPAGASAGPAKVSFGKRGLAKAR